METTLIQQDRTAEIMAANQQFMAAFAQGATTMGDFYTTDAHLLPPNSDFIRGNRAIDTFWVAVYGSGVKRATLETVEANQDGKLVIETGKYTLHGDNDTQLDTGKYLVVWKKEGASWKLHRDIFNTSMSPAGAV